eukprot:gene15651-21758_t
MPYGLALCTSYLSAKRPAPSALLPECSRCTRSSAVGTVTGVSMKNLKNRKIVFLLRLSPLFPFGLLNYALGLTTISLPKYVLASWGGMLPATFAYGAAATLLAVKVASSAASKALQDAESADDKA